MHEGSDKDTSSNDAAVEALPEGYSAEFIRQQFDSEWLRLKTNHEELLKEINLVKGNGFVPLDRCDEFLQRVRSLRKEMIAFRIKASKSFDASGSFYAIQADKFIADLSQQESKLSRLVNPDLFTHIKTPERYREEVERLVYTKQQQRRLDTAISLATFAVVLGVVGVLGYKNLSNMFETRPGKSSTAQPVTGGEKDLPLQAAAPSKDAVVLKSQDYAAERWWKDGRMDEVAENTRNMLSDSPGVDREDLVDQPVLAASVQPTKSDKNVIVPVPQKTERGSDSPRLIVNHSLWIKGGMPKDKQMLLFFSKQIRDADVFGFHDGQVGKSVLYPLVSGWLAGEFPGQDSRVEAFFKSVDGRKQLDDYLDECCVDSKLSLEQVGKVYVLSRKVMVEWLGERLKLES